MEVIENKTIQVLRQQITASVLPSFLTDLQLNPVFANEAAINCTKAASSREALKTLLSPGETERCRDCIVSGKSFSIRISPVWGCNFTLTAMPIWENGAVIGANIIAVPDDDIIVNEYLTGEASSAVSASLREPLNEIFACINAVTHTPEVNKTSSVGRSMAIINRNAYKLLRYAMNMTYFMRSYSKIREKTVTIDFWSRMSELAQACSAAVHSKANLKYSFPEGAAAVCCHFPSIAAAFANIISNACKYSGENNEILVTGDVKDGRVEVTVTDHGEGIPEEQLERIFEPYATLSHKEMPDDSVGLGLSAARQIICSQGGSIESESALGKGTSITFSLPLAQSDIQPPLPLECGSDAYLLDRFSPVYVMLSDVVDPPEIIK